MTHPSVSSYNAGCRCEECRTAAREYYRQLRRRRGIIERTEPPCGTNSAYTNRACRCEECSNAHKESNRQRYLKTNPNARRYGKRQDYAKKYGVSSKQVQRIGVELLNAMTEDARSVMFSTIKWNQANPNWHQRIAKRTMADIFPDAPKPVPQHMRQTEVTEKPWEPDLAIYEGIQEVKPGRKAKTEKFDSVERMMQLVDSLYAKRRAA